MKKTYYILLFVFALLLLTGCSKDKYTTLCENVVSWVDEYKDNSKSNNEIINLFDSEYNSKCTDTEKIEAPLGTIMSYNTNRQCNAIKQTIEDSNNGLNSEMIENDIIIAQSYCRRFLDGTLE